MPSAPLVEVAATIEVLVAPRVARLYFWALQVGFSGGGAAHTGLQWLPADGGMPAVNWGGYAPNGRELDGTRSELADVDGNLNTRRFGWEPAVPYRLRVFRSPAGNGWRASVNDVVVRDLYGRGEFLASPIVWSEVFAACDDPPVVVRWSGFEAVDRDGRTLVPPAVTVTYQQWADGGCTNTDVEVDERGVRQVTAATRRTPHGAVVAVPGPG